MVDETGSVPDVLWCRNIHEDGDSFVERRVVGKI